MKRSYTGREYARDDRDFGYPIFAKATTRKKRNWRDTAFVFDQGAEPSCVGAAWAHWLANVPIVQVIDHYGIYRLAQYVDEWQGQDYPGTSVRAGVKILKMLGFVGEYRWTWLLPNIVSALLNDGPVVVGTDWLADMDNPDADGLIHATGKLLGGHAYLLNGVDTRTRLFRLKNSWGRGWGIKGRAFISFDDMNKLMGRDGECCLAIETEPAKVLR